MDKNTKGVVFMGASRTILTSIRISGTTYGHRISRDSGITWSHITAVIEILEELGLLRKLEKKGRIIPVVLTDKGERVADKILEIELIVGGK